ncbi:MAG: type II toxin-antitoxin system HicA family toxin [Candidatus Latescibacterota bacterium]
MKRTEFIREMVSAGCFLKRHENNHDIHMNPRNGKKAPVPRHNELKDTLCEQIRKQLALE